MKEDEERRGGDRWGEAGKQLLAGGLAGSVAKTVTAPFSRLAILFQVHSLVTTKENRPKFAMSLSEGFQKIIERGGLTAMWKGNMTSVIHRFPYSAINFFVYEHTLDILSDRVETTARWQDTMHKFSAGAMAGTTAVTACYPLDLVRTRLTTELEGRERYRGIVDAFSKIYRAEGIMGFYAGISPTLCVAIPNFAISYSVYGTLKEYMIDDDLFYNLRRVAADGAPQLGAALTVLCGAASGILATLVTFPMDTVRRRMQVQSLHVKPMDQLTSYQLLQNLVSKEGLMSVYRGLTPELLKVVPMVGTMFWVYEQTKEFLNMERR